jgi:hypothetical protein
MQQCLLVQIKQSRAVLAELLEFRVSSIVACPIAPHIVIGHEIEVSGWQVLGAVVFLELLNGVSLGLP